MVLEALFNPFKVKKKPWEMFIAGVIYALVGLILSYFVFKEVAAILMVFLVVIAVLPLFYTTIQNEEKLDLRYTKESRLLKEHGKVLSYLLFLFFGITVAFVFAYVFFPSTVVSSVFGLQERAILNVNDNIRGLLTGGITRFDVFVRILVNNIKVLFFTLLFSVIYGTGAIFILTWNASVIATAIGALVKKEIALTTAAAGFTSLSSYFNATFFGFFRYMTHGTFEIAAYFVMGLAGGIISIAVIRHNLNKDQLIIDVLDLVFISLGLLVVAAITEVYITPLLFG